MPESTGPGLSAREPPGFRDRAMTEWVRQQRRWMASPHLVDRAWALFTQMMAEVKGFDTSEVMGLEWKSTAAQAVEDLMWVRQKCGLDMFDDEQKRFRDKRRRKKEANARYRAKCRARRVSKDTAT